MIQLVLLIQLSTTGAMAQVVDRVVAVVGDRGDQLVTASDIALEEALAPLDSTELPFWNQRHGDALERLEDAAMVRVAASDVALYQPAPDAVRQRVAAIRDRFPNEAAWQAWLDRWGLDEDGLAAVLKRRMVVEKFLLRNLSRSPLDEAAWLAEMHEQLAALETRIPIRRIELQDRTP
jgi:hypothetical protein